MRGSRLRSLAGRLVFAAAACGFSPCLEATTVSWVPNADGSWHIASNWSSNPALPGPTDDVVIDVGGATVRTITHSQDSTSILSLVSQEHFTISGGTLMISGIAQVNGNFNMTGGTLIGATLAGSPIAVSGRLSGVTVNGGMNALGGVISDGLTLNSVANITNSTLRFEGTQVSGGTGTVIFGMGGGGGGGTLLVDGDSTLTIGSGVTLRGERGSIGPRTSSTFGPSTLLNQGRISSDMLNGTLSIDSNVLINTETLEAKLGGILNVSSGTFTSNGDITANIGSAVNITSVFSATAGSIGGAGAVRATAGTTVSGNVVKQGSGVVRVNETLSIPAGSTLDIVAGTVINDYSVGSSFDVLRARIVSGYNEGAWNGTGIASSTGAATPGFGLGYAESSSLFSSFPIQFAGELIDNTAVLIRYTRYGDANLSGSVDLNDFNRLAANFGSAGNWSEGDFTYDGFVNLDDFNRLAANFGLSAGPDGPGPEDWAALGAAVPEPSLALLVGMGNICLLRRRRRG